MDLGQWIVIILSFFLAAWYLGANIFNRRKGITTYYWLRRGLEKLGKITEAEWLGSSGSGAKLVVGKAAKPFGKIEAIYMLETREILPFWIVNHLRGKRDEIIVKATLRSTPKQEFEVGRTGDRQFASLQSDETMDSFEQVPAPEGFQILWHGHKDEQRIEQLIAFLSQEGVSVQRISMHRKIPHLVINARLKPLIDSPAESFFTKLQAWLGG